MDQIRRSSQAVNAMIAEARGRRRHRAVFVSKLNEALGERTETQSWLDDARDGQYISTEQFSELDSKYVSVGQMLSRMIGRGDDFCNHPPATDCRSVSRVQEADQHDDDSPSLEEFFA